MIQLDSVRHGFMIILFNNIAVTATRLCLNLTVSGLITSSNRSGKQQATSAHLSLPHL